MDKSTVQIVLWLLAALFLVLYMARRSARRKKLSE